MAKEKKVEEPQKEVEVAQLSKEDIFEIGRLLDQIRQQNAIGRWPLPPEQWNAIENFKKVYNG